MFSGGGLLRVLKLLAVCYYMVIVCSHMFPPALLYGGPLQVYAAQVQIYVVFAAKCREECSRISEGRMVRKRADSGLVPATRTSKNNLKSRSSSG